MKPHKNEGAHKDEVKAWLQKAYSDLCAAQILVTHNAIVRDAAVFHCQQAAEKALKAFLVWQAVPFDRVHNLTYLLDLCEVENGDFATLREVAESLTPYAVEVRYPGASLWLSAADVAEALIGTEAVWNLVLQLLPTELGASITEEVIE